MRTQRDSDHAAVVKAEGGVVPHFGTEQHLVVELGKLRSEVAELSLSGGPQYFLLCHNIKR